MKNNEQTFAIACDIEGCAINIDEFDLKIQENISQVLSSMNNTDTFEHLNIIKSSEGLVEKPAHHEKKRSLADDGLFSRNNKIKVEITSSSYTI